ncbi:hypothetical protein H0H81_008744 [Sphagnurus paluster]|uniref:NAD(P)-binding protein n=1 Tax=Sphagnurus paluster TaxID=117069 RepID=A0A9P7GLC1_9AGAR|nr:hypothetical protein H0H81_008744 [Sphagnurus paluster]
MDPDLKQSFDGQIISEKDWGNVTESEFLEKAGGNAWMWDYGAAKILSERAAWKFAEAEPALDLAIILPPYIFGPYAPGFPVPAKTTPGSNKYIYSLLEGSIPSLKPSLFCDVRDVTHAHVAVLTIPRSTKNVEDKRFLVSGGVFKWKETVEYLHEKRPELKARLPPVDAAFAPLPGPISIIDATRSKEVLGIRSYRHYWETLESTIDALLEAEKQWI